MGETQIIIELAKEEMTRGINPIQAIKNAQVQFKIALDKAMDYEFKELKWRRKTEKLFEQLKKEQKNEFVENNIAMVYSIASKHFLWTKDKNYFDDLINEGVIGMMLGYDKFEPNKGNKLSTYCYTWAWSKMQRYVDITIENKRSSTNFEKPDVVSFENHRMGTRSDNHTLADVLCENDINLLDVGENYIIYDFVEYCKEYGIEEVARLKFKGYTEKEIAEMLGLSYRSIRYKYMKAFDSFVSYYKKLEGVV